MLIAAVNVLMEQGYARASTLEIATRARVSKRELYAEFGSKRGILEALIATSAKRMMVPLAPAEIGDRHALAAALSTYGAAALATLTNPYVLAMYRLAIAEAPADSELGSILDASGRQPNRQALVEIVRCQRVIVSGCQVLDAQPYGIQVADSSLVSITGCSILETRSEKKTRAAIRFLGKGAGNYLAVNTLGAEISAATTAGVKIGENLLASDV